MENEDLHLIAESVLFWMKAGGAAMGSSIAIVFRPGDDEKGQLFKRFILGTIIGFVLAPVLIDLIGWAHTPDYWLAAATMSGLLGYLFLQFLFSEAASNAVKKRFGS